MRELTKLAPAERQRVYHFGDDGALVFEDVVAFAASESGTHYLETGDGLKHIVAPGWTHITLDVDRFSV